MVACALIAYLALPSVVVAQPTASPTADAEQVLHDELNKQLNNPVSTNKLTLPVGFGAGKLFKLGKLPVKLTLEVDYSLVKPEDYGQRWNIRFQMIPVIPALVKDALFKIGAISPRAET